jgi:hypothetical protein
MSAPPLATAPNPHTNSLNVYIQLANKMGFQQQKIEPLDRGLGGSHRGHVQCKRKTEF